MKKLVLLLAVATLVVASAVFSVAQDQPAGASSGPGPMMQRMGSVPCAANAIRPFSVAMLDGLSKRLQLTDEQKPKVLELLTAADATLKTKVDANRKAAEAFVSGIRSNADEATLQAAGKAALAAEAEVLTQKVTTFVALRALLTDAQKTELAKMVQMGPMMMPGSMRGGAAGGNRPPDAAPAAPPAP